MDNSKPKVHFNAVSFISSLTGFHKPNKHSNLSPTEFLASYVSRQERFIKNGNRPDERREWVDLIVNDWPGAIKEIEKRFPRTFDKNWTFAKLRSKNANLLR